MADRKRVVRAFLRVRVTGNFAVFGRVGKILFAARKHFVRIALVGHVKHEFVRRRVKHIVHGYGRLNKPQVRAEMAARGVYFAD